MPRRTPLAPSAGAAGPAPEPCSQLASPGTVTRFMAGGSAVRAILLLEGLPRGAVDWIRRSIRGSSGCHRPRYLRAFWSPAWSTPASILMAVSPRGTNKRSSTPSGLRTMPVAVPICLTRSRSRPARSRPLQRVNPVHETLARAGLRKALHRAAQHEIGAVNASGLPDHVNTAALARSVRLQLRAG